MSDPTPKALFLSYARDDAASARRIAEALRSSGLEVWFDENELRGGDIWDAKIRKQIDACALFIPVISQHTESRAKGYFRLEWNLAVDQTKMLAAGVPFIAPVAIDDTKESGASVPAEFLRVHWMRLPGALPTPQFVEQVKRLLEAPQKLAMEPGRPRPGQRGEGAASPGMPHARGRRVPPAAWIVVGALAIVAVAVFLGRQSTNTNAGTRPSTIEKSAAPVSEARQLVAKARALYEPWNLATFDDFALAEQLLKKAVELDPADGDAWAAYAILSCAMVVNGGGNATSERIAEARNQAERAFKLSPDSNAARFARAFSLRFNPETRDECLRLLREEAARQPDNRTVARILGMTLSAFGQHEQGLLYLDRAAALPGRDPVTLYNRGQVLERLGRFVEEEAAIDEALAIAPQLRAAQSMKLGLLLNYHGDLAEARQHLGKVPPGFLSEDDSAAVAGLVWLYSRDPVKCLEVLRPVGDYARSPEYSGPKAYLTGWAHSLAGNIDAARTDWRTALRLVQKNLDARPNAESQLVNKAALLAVLGERTEAESLLREIRQRATTGGRRSAFDIARILSLLGKKDEALAALDEWVKEPVIKDGTVTQRIHLRYSPEWDLLRGDPRFEALLKGPEPKK